MSTAHELFGNDSSSSDGDNHLQESVSEAKTSKAASVDGVALVDGDDDAISGIAKSSKPSPKKPSILDADSDSSDDDNEPEFDDDGAVVGVAASSRKTTKPSTNNRPTSDSADDDDLSMEEREEKEEGDSRTLVVQESTRPPQSLCMTKLPNLVGVQTTAFDEIEYSKRQEDEDFGKAAYNLIRWRYKTNSSGDPVRGDNDELIRESNTRLVEWEDGTYTMHVGEEVFNIDMIDSSQSNGFPGLNGYLFLSSQAATYKEDDAAAGTVLECMGSIRNRIVIKPTSLQSDAHKILTHSIRQKTIKTARIAEHVTQEDPEKLKQAREKMKSDLDKVNVRKSTTGGSRPRMSRRYMNEGVEEEEDDEDTYNLKAMKRRAMEGGYDDEESEDDEYGDSFRQAKKKKKDESSEDEEMHVDDEDEDAPIMASKKKRQTGVFDDDDSD